QVRRVGGGAAPPAGHLVADELRRHALALRHPPHLPGDQALPGRFELCHVALPSAGITRVRFEGSAGSPCILSRLERGGSPSVVRVLAQTITPRAPQVKGAVTAHRPAPAAPRGAGGTSGSWSRHAPAPRGRAPRPPSGG